MNKSQDNNKFSKIILTLLSGFIIINLIIPVIPILYYFNEIDMGFILIIFMGYCILILLLYKYYKKFSDRKPLSSELDKILNSTKDIDISNYKFYVQDSHLVNAYAYSHNKITVTREALKVSDEVLRSIILHEIGHIKKLHTLFSMIVVFNNVIFFVLVSPVFLCIYLFSDTDTKDKKREFTIFDIIFLLLLPFLIFYYIFYGVYGKIISYISRKHEYSADNYVLLNGGGKGLYELLSICLNQEIPQGLIDMLNSSHPIIANRMRKIEEFNLNNNIK